MSVTPLASEAVGGVELGKLMRIEDIRSLWRHERHDFSAWLLDNPDVLSDVLGIEVTLERAEERVGDFWLDLIGEDHTHGTVLIVENQLEATDHSHLGQTLLYAAGASAGTVVWIAKQFRAEHRQALSWLNETTTDDVRFFGVEVAAVRIGDSPPAPLLSLAVQPSESQRRVRERADAARLSGKSRHYADFWARFLERVRAEHPDWTRRGPGVRSANWLDMPSSIPGTYLAASFARGRRLRHELYIDCGDADRNAHLFQALEGGRAELEAAYGRPLTFEELPDKQASRVAEYFEGADASEVDRYDEFVDWFIDAGRRLRTALSAVEIPSFED
jgi:hypothetical protein